MESEENQQPTGNQEGTGAAANCAANDTAPPDVALAKRIDRIKRHGEAMVVVGAVHGSPAELRDLVQEHANKNGFKVSTNGLRMECTRAAQSNGHHMKQARKALVSADKGKNRPSTRCGCSWRISHTRVDKSDKHWQEWSSGKLGVKSCLLTRIQFPVSVPGKGHGRLVLLSWGAGLGTTGGMQCALSHWVIRMQCHSGNWNLCVVGRRA